MKIQRIVPIAIATVAILILAACTEPSRETAADTGTEQPASGRASAPVIDRILEAGVLRVGTTADWQPMTYINPDTNEYEGYYVDIVRDLATDMGVEIEWVPTTWQDKVAGIAAGRYEITTGASFNLGRARQGAFTLPIAVVGTVPLTRAADLGRFSSWEDINSSNVRVAVTLGTTQDQQAQAFFPEAELVRPDSGARDYQEILAGRADVSITSNIEAQTLTARFPDLVIIPVEPRATLPNGMIVDRDEQEWLTYVNTWITMKEYDGYFDRKAAEYGLAF